MKKDLKRFTVFLDMDGVVANWYDGFESLFTSGLTDNDLNEEEKVEARNYFRKNQFVESCPLRERKFWGQWKELSNRDNGKWWRELDPLPWAKQLYESIYECPFVEEVGFLTSPGKDYTLCWEQKRQWLKENIGTDNVVITPYKYHCAKRGTILIDDTWKHVEKFKEHGGAAFLWPNQDRILNFSHEDPPECKWAGDGFTSVCDIEEDLVEKLIERLKFDIMCRIGILNPPDEEKKKKIRELHEKAGHVE